MFTARSARRRPGRARGVGIAAGLAQGAPLPQQVPALIEPDLDRIEPSVLALAEPAFGSTFVELVLLRDELFDPGVDALVCHFVAPNLRPARRAPTPRTRGAAR